MPKQATKNVVPKKVTKPTKVVKKRLIGFTADMDKGLNDLEKSTGKNPTQVMEMLLTGEDKFNPAIEDMILAYQKEKNVGRKQAIEALLIRAIAAKPSNS